MSAKREFDPAEPPAFGQVWHYESATVMLMHRVAGHGGAWVGVSVTAVRRDPQFLTWYGLDGPGRPLAGWTRLA